MNNFVSSFNGISTFVGYLMKKLSLIEENQGFFNSWLGV